MMTIHAGKVQAAVSPVERPEDPAASDLKAGDLRVRAGMMAAAAAAAADRVDQEARFPAEAYAAAKAQHLLGIQVPADLGGEAASVSDVADICYMLGRACASTAMIYAMHSIMVRILVRHAPGSAYHRSLLHRLCTEQLLLASSTTDGQGGGNLRASTAAVETTGDRIMLTKNGTVLSYGAEADGIVTTARRSPDAAPSEQVLVALTKADYQLDPIATWNALGMRGTCSSGYALKAQAGADQVLPEPYQRIHAHSMMPVAHLTWSSVWTGVAAGAVDRAKQFVRKAARGAGGQMPPGAIHLTRATASLRALRGMVAAALAQYEAAAARPEAMDSYDFQTSMNLLKVNASELAITTVMNALQTCGLTGYRNDGELSVARHIRDILSTSIMINNDRILASTANAAMLAEIPMLLRDNV
jgi:acyl-CoA dehydrogenase